MKQATRTGRQQAILAEVQAAGRTIYWDTTTKTMKALDALAAAGLVTFTEMSFTRGSSRGIRYETRYTVRPTTQEAK
jgi:hypothetical protein